MNSGELSPQSFQLGQVAETFIMRVECSAPAIFGSDSKDASGDSSKPQESPSSVQSGSAQRTRPPPCLEGSTASQEQKHSFQAPGESCEALTTMCSISG